MKNFILGFLIASLLFGGFWVFIQKTSHETPVMQKTARKYYCPMHPTYISDKPGDCPICSMRLVPLEETAPSLPTPQKDAQKYYCPMHPDQVSGKPGQCPVCKMALVPMEPHASKDKHAGHAATPEQSQAVPGYVPVRIHPERQQMMGIILEEAKIIELEQNIRTVGRVTYDETQLHHVHTKFEGYIEHTYVNYVGQFVKRGDPLFTVYSPELVATQKEYLLALRAKEQQVTFESHQPLAGLDLLEAARQRLTLWDIEPDEIAQLQETRLPIKAVTIRSPFTGFVSEKIATHGMKVTPEERLYAIIDLSSVWVLVDVYEVNLPFVKLGQPAEISLPYQPGKTWRGKVSYVYPTLDERTRTVKVRLEFPNPAGLLKPEMYAGVLLKSSQGKALAVPESAVITTGERNVVFVAKEVGLFEPREVSTGVKVRNYYEIKSGISPGEKVVTGANFLLDSESKLKAAISGIGHRHGQ